MITKEQAMTADSFHLGNCSQKVGKRGAIRITISQWRRSGQTKTWITRPKDFRVPVKYGLYQHGYVVAQHAQDWHVPEDCPMAGASRLEMYKRHYLNKGE